MDMKTVVGVYDDLEEARDVVDDLVEAGTPRDDISLVTRDVTGEYGEYLDEYDAVDESEIAEGAAEAAVGGAVVGGLTGVLVGLGALAVPGLGPVIAAGPIAAGLTGAGVGAVTGGLLGALVEWGIPEEEAEYYAESVRRGSTLVAVRVADTEMDDVVTIMNDYDAVDVERRAQYWREEEDWQGYDADAEPFDAADIQTFREREEEWYEEDDDDFDLSDDDWDVDLPDFEDFEDLFQEDYDENYAGRGYTYSQCVPAYRYGYNLATDPRYRDHEWNEVESVARERWEEHNEGTWEEFKDAVHHAWNEVKEAVS
jgi:hypothetical protein